jgi:putative spermidine/putrescine transport system substrate-binding protein
MVSSLLSTDLITTPEVRRKMNKKIISVFVGTVLALALSSSALPSQAATKAPAKATSATDVGGLAALVKLAQKEGELNVIALPDYWANYGNIIKRFEAKYKIKVNS